MSSRRAAIFVPALALAGSQAGHLLVYAVRFGTASAQLQSSGAHAYFPLVAKTGLGIAAALLIAGFFVVGLARLLTGRPLRDGQPPPPFIPLLAALFTLQLASFAAQESIEAYAAGTTLGSAPALLLWGALGQLPVALVSALAIRWVLTRVAVAITEIRAVAARSQPHPRLVLAVAAMPRGVDRSALRTCLVGSSLALRGPPVLRPISI